MILFKLVCGDRELDLADATNWFPLRHGFTDEGNTVTISYHIADDNDCTQALSRLLHEIEWYNARAVTHTIMEQGEPVYLGMKPEDGNEYETTLGRGWVYKQLEGWDLQDEPAIRVELPEEFLHSWNQAYIDDVPVTFRCKAMWDAGHGARIYPWTTRKPRWVGLAQGAIQTDDDGGLIVLEATTNKIPNSDFENEADTNNGWTCEDAHVTDAETTDPEYVYSGFFSQLLVEDGDGDKTYTVSIDVGNANKHSLSCYAKKVDGSAVSSSDVVLYYGGALTTTFTADSTRGSGWYRLTSENFDGVAAATDCGVQVKQSKTVYVDSFQLEEKAYCTPLAYGTFGRGYTFSSTAHTTSSVRAAAGIKYRNAEGWGMDRILYRDKATIMVVAEMPYASDGFKADSYLFCDDDTRIRLHYDQANTRFEFQDGTNSAETGACTFSANAILWVFAQYSSAGLAVKAYNSAGTLVGTAGTDASFAAPAASDWLWIGSTDTAGTGCWGDATIHEVKVWHQVLTATEMTDLVAAGRGSGELPYLYSIQGSGALMNRDDTDSNADNWCELGNFPGDYDAGLKLMVKNLEANAVRHFYTSMHRGGVPKADIPSKWHLVGNHFRGWFEAENDIATKDADASNQVDATCSAGNKLRFSPSDTDEDKVIELRICQEPEDVWRYMGRYLVMLLTYTGTSDHFDLRFRCLTAQVHTGPYTQVETADAGSTWRPLVPENQYVTLPSVVLSEEDAQHIRPGDYAASASGDYLAIEVWCEPAAASGDLDMDAIWLMDAGMSGYAQLHSDSDWAQNKWLVLDAASYVPRFFFADDEDTERIISGCDYEGFLPTVPPHDPVIAMFGVRAATSPYEWDVDDTFTVYAKYRPRYRKTV